MTELSVVPDLPADAEPQPKPKRRKQKPYKRKPKPVPPDTAVIPEISDEDLLRGRRRAGVLHQRRGRLLRPHQPVALLGPARRDPGVILRGRHAHRAGAHRRPRSGQAAVHPADHQGDPAVVLPARQRHPGGAEEDAAPDPHRGVGRQLEGPRGLDRPRLERQSNSDCR